MADEQPASPSAVPTNAAMGGASFNTNIGGESHVHTVVNAGRVEQLVVVGSPPVTSLHQLPPDVAGFTGRGAALNSVLTPFTAREPDDTSVPVVAISGRAGVGKTALAIHAAHRLRGHFSDVQLYLQMRGVNGERKSPADALSELLRSLGVEDVRVPPTQAERASLFRSMVASRRFLIVLDDVQDEEQVLPLLPGSATGGVLITSRGRLAALDGTLLYNLAELCDEEALSLFSRLCGDDRVYDERDAALEIVRLCDLLPLAIKIVGGRLRGKPELTLADELVPLRDEHHRLERLRLGHLSIRSALMLSYNALDAEQQRLFQSLGMVTWPNFPSPVLAHALGLDFTYVSGISENFIDLQLLEGIGSGRDRRYHLHELVRLFARECRDQEVSQGDQRAQRRRVIDATTKQAGFWYEYLAPGSHKDKVERLASTQGRTFEDMQREVLSTALTWFDREQDMLHVAARWAFEEQEWRATVSLANDLMVYASMRFRSEDAALEETQLLALKAAQELGERKLEALIRNHLHAIYRRKGRYGESLAMVEGALSIWKSEGNAIAVGQTTDNIAILVRQMGHPDLAAEGHRRAIALFEQEMKQAGNEDMGLLLTVSTLHLAICYAMQGEIRDAVKQFHRCLKLCRHYRDRHREAEVLQGLSILYSQRGKATCNRVVTLLNASLHIACELHDEEYEGSILFHLGNAHESKGDVQQAAKSYGEALSKTKLNSQLSEAINQRLAILN